MAKLLLLNKNDTIVTRPSRRLFVNKPWDQMLIQGVRLAIANYQKKGWKIAIVSNQSQVGQGYKSLESTILEMRYCLELIEDNRGVSAYFCPDDGETCWRVWGECDKDQQVKYDSSSYTNFAAEFIGQFRKPSPGMLKLAIKNMLLPSNDNEVMMVGDNPEDRKSAEAAGISFMSGHDWRNGF